jgi:glutathione S-transferase
MALKIYGIARSRAARVLWIAKELGLDYEHIKVDFATARPTPPLIWHSIPTGMFP